MRNGLTKPHARSLCLRLHFPIRPRS